MDIEPNAVEKFILHEVPRNSLSGLLWSLDMGRWISHNDGLNSKPYLTEGISGFVDQHIGNAFPTVSLIWLARVPVEIGAKVIETFTSKKLSARAKLYMAIMIGSAWPLLGESGIVSNGGTADPLDHFGTLAAMLAVTAGFEISEFLSKPTPPKIVHAFEKVRELAVERSNATLSKIKQLMTTNDY
jgi:hypothetical protein